MMLRIRACLMVVVLGASAAWTAGCGENATFLNSSFINYTQGGVIPLAPGQASGFNLIRLVNQTDNPIQFIVTVERYVIVEEGGEETAQVQTQTYQLDTYPNGLTNEVGLLVDCGSVRIGLGENLNFPEDEPGLFIGVDAGTDEIITGFGVPARVNPLDARAGNYSCGDTLIFQATTQVGVPGNIAVKSYVLLGATQPTEYSGPDTFNNARSLLDRTSGGGS
ncbi:MAG: hypothetical protein JXB13_04845 [Phycisphaerae bacterium]|nr:hypothetical protein [Phycisphaerae bacterium]